MIWVIFTKILKYKIQTKNENYWLYLIADMLSSKKLNLIVTELLTELFTTQLSFAVPKSLDYFIIKILNKWELQQILFNYSRDSDFQDFMNFYKKFTAKPYYF